MRAKWGSLTNHMRPISQGRHPPPLCVQLSPNVRPYRRRLIRVINKGRNKDARDIPNMKVIMLHNRRMPKRLIVGGKRNKRNSSHREQKSITLLRVMCEEWGKKISE